MYFCTESYIISKVYDKFCVSKFPITGEDFNPKLPGNVTLYDGKKVARIPIAAKLDTLLEDNESFEVIASPPSDSGLSCKTNVTIIDNSKLWN